MPDWLQILLAVASVLTPVVLAAAARDRQLLSIMNKNKEEAVSAARAEHNNLHDRINRIRDEFVRRDDFDAHMTRLDKRLDDFRDEMREASASTNRRLDSIIHKLNGKAD